MRLRASIFVVPLVAGIAVWHAVARGDERVAADKHALAPLQPYVGEWRGVGQPKRGSNQGAWTEACEWSWRFEDGHAQLVAQFDHDKYFARLRAQPGEQPGKFTILAEPADGTREVKSQRFTGAISNGVLVAVDENAPADRPARISLQLVANGDRMVVLFEKRLGAGIFGRMAEVGSTRKGSSFAKNATSGTTNIEARIRIGPLRDSYHLICNINPAEPKSLRMLLETSRPCCVCRIASKLGNSTDVCRDSPVCPWSRICLSKRSCITA